MERKLATVVFVDLVGSTEFVAARDPEVVRRRVNSFFEHVSHCITTHGGIVEKFAGDAVMAAFGIPQAHEDDAERAVRAAAAILDSVHELGLEARIGVEAGEVVADESESTFATGEAVNLILNVLLVMGLGLDYALFFNRSEASAQERAHTLYGLLVCATTTILVFGILATSTIPVLHAIGLTASVGSFCCLLFTGLMAKEKVHVSG